MLPPDTAFILDSLSMIHRAYHVPVPNLTAPDGSSTKTVFVLSRMLLSLLQEFKPRVLYAAFDNESSHEYRQAIYPAYKEKPQPSKEDLGKFLKQEEAARQLFATFGIRRIQLPCYEADDIIASFAEVVKPGRSVCMVGMDKDFFQLIDDRVVMYDPGRKKLLNAATVEEERGFRPDESANVQALTGDPTDNVPGVKGVGPKTAVKLLRKYGSLDGIFDHLSELSSKLQERLIGKQEQVRMALRLVTLKRDLLPKSYLPQRLLVDPVWKIQVKEMFHRFGFSRQMMGWVELVGDGYEKS